MPISDRQPILSCLQCQYHTDHHSVACTFHHVSGVAPAMRPLIESLCKGKKPSMETQDPGELSSNQSHLPHSPWHITCLPSLPQNASSPPLHLRTPLNLHNHHSARTTAENGHLSGASALPIGGAQEWDLQMCLYSMLQYPAAVPMCQTLRIWPLVRMWYSLGLISN